MDLTVLPNLIEFPNLPSNILSPVNVIKGLILDFSLKLPPVLLGPFKSIDFELFLVFFITPPNIA